jgi:hypothetical protein
MNERSDYLSQRKDLILDNDRFNIALEWHEIQVGLSLCELSKTETVRLVDNIRVNSTSQLRRFRVNQ